MFRDFYGDEINICASRPLVLQSPDMMTDFERSDLLHIMKTNRLVLIDSDSAHLSFTGRVKEKEFVITILTIENLPQVIIKCGSEIIFNEVFALIDEVKIFLDERLYKYLEG